MLLPYDTGNMLHHMSYTIVYHYFTPAFMFNWGPSGPSTAATAMASATPKLPTLPPVAVSMVNSLFWDTIWGPSSLDLARIWQDAVALFSRIPDIIFTLLALAWLDITGCWKVLFGQCQAAPTRSQWRASEELEVSQLCRRQRLSMAE